MPSSSSASKKSAPKSAPKRAARKPARATKVAPAAGRHRWLALATRVIDEANPLSVPYDVFLNEARAAASFVRKRWNPLGSTPGLSRVRKRLPETTPDEIAELLEAIQAAHTEATLTVTPEGPPLNERATELITELADALDFTLGADDPKSDDALRFAKVRGFHNDHGLNPASRGQDLRNHAVLADSLRVRLLEDDEGFDASLIDEAQALASKLLRPSLTPPATAADGTVVTDEGAFALRNRLLRLLAERVSLVRRCARRVFKLQPEVLKEVTSAYDRERRARARQARAEVDGADVATDEPADTDEAAENDG